MNRYRLTLMIDDETEAETLEAAWAKFNARVKQGYYGPIKENVEFLEEVPVEEIITPAE
ncbi:hypothetical protein ES703_14219 [subsurface metagenome]